jgi:hypothetical protein
MGKKNRTSRRHKTLGLMSYIADGNSTFMGVVEDISKNGVRIAQIPADFNESIAQCQAVIQCPTGDYSISLQPCWVRSTNRGMYNTIGFKIIDPPPNWQAIVEDLENGGGELGFLVLSSDNED